VTYVGLASPAVTYVWLASSDLCGTGLTCSDLCVTGLTCSDLCGTGLTCSDLWQSKQSFRHFVQALVLGFGVLGLFCHSEKVITFN